MIKSLNINVVNVNVMIGIIYLNFKSKIKFRCCCINICNYPALVCESVSIFLYTVYDLILT